jgi:hypothetical protein
MQGIFSESPSRPHCIKKTRKNHPCVFRQMLPERIAGKAMSAGIAAQTAWTDFHQIA